MKPARWPAVAAIIGLVAALIVLVAGPAMASGAVGWQLGLAGFALSALVAGIVTLVLLVAVVRGHRSRLVMAGFVAALVAAVVPGGIVIQARDKPPIHDIATDTDNPPAFVAITPAMRGPGSNPVSYDPAVAAQQKAAYPLVRPVTLAVPMAQAFVAAEAAARAMDWQIIATDAPSGRIEATATVPWWGFHDDVVVRLTPVEGGTQVDVRSKSRVGQGDLGVNAERVQGYLNRLGNG